MIAYDEISCKIRYVTDYVTGTHTVKRAEVEYCVKPMHSMRYLRRDYSGDLHVAFTDVSYFRRHERP
jgi:hypothetical protein